MYVPNRNTAVLVFIRSEEEEAHAKKFGACLSFAGNYQVVALLNERVKGIAKDSGLPIVVIAGNQQNGDNFGERFTDAIKQVFIKGYENVIAIGNDCLSITPELLRKAAQQLETKKAVLGPTEDGGIYLLGFKKDTFSPSQLTELPWQTNQLFNALQNHLQNSQPDQFHLFEISIDADDAGSFQTVLNNLQSHSSFKNKLKSLLQLFPIQQPFFINFQPQLLFKNSLSHRGPPPVISCFQ